jgi:hypothetical protein
MDNGCFIPPNDEKDARKLREHIVKVGEAANKILDPHMDHLHVKNMKKVCECCFKCYNQKWSAIDGLQECLSICESAVDGDKVTFDTEFSQFQERLGKSLKICQDSYKGADFSREMVSCCVRAMENSTDEELPKLANKLNASFGLDKQVGKGKDIA